MKQLMIFFIFFILLIPESCNQENKAQKKFVIGFSQCTTGDAWRQKMNEEMKREISFYRDYDIDLLIKDAQNSNQKQILQIKELLNQDIDLLIVSPNEAAPLTPILEKVYKQGIPVIVIDRKIKSDKFTAYIGADNLSIGKEAGRFAVELLNGNGKIVEITGLKGSTPAMERSEGFRAVTDKYPKIKITRVYEGKWLKNRAKTITDTAFKHYQNFDLIFAHNDRMAYSAYKSTEKYSLDPYILGIDGLNTPNGGISLVLEDKIDGTFLYPTGGDKAIQLAIDILVGESFYKYNSLHTTRIDSTNARAYRLQAQKLKEQQEQIDKQLELIGELDFLIQRKNTFLILTLMLIISLLFIVGLTYYYLMRKKRINRKLAAKNSTIEKQNKTIIQQRDHMENMVKVAEEANEMKLRFFTNISHEFKTILSLISFPVDDLLESVKDTKTREKLQTIRKSTDRLINMCREIMNFRKLDKNKYQVEFHRGNIAKFISDIAATFQGQAVEHNINLLTDIPKQIEADFDPGIMEKVMFNMISNALKFTPKNGKVHVITFVKDSYVHIIIKDTGYGISEDELPYVFDRFFRGKNDSLAIDQGSGIGLAFSKELIQLHGGKIQVNSKKGEGTAFQISLPKYHKKPEQNIENVSKANITPSQYIENGAENTVLLVEDNPELRAVIKDTLWKYFNVIEARDGDEGLKLSKYHIPDIIISDILMPNMDGMEMCSYLKENPITQHIPIILLTAIDSQESSIRGFDTGADDYITKPFNENVLIARIQNLIDSRKILMESIGGKLLSRKNVKSRAKEDQEFIKKCMEVIYKNAASEDFHLKQLAMAMNMSQSTLYRKIKQLTGMKAVDFLKKTKLQLAASLLLKKNMSISEVAWESGFTDEKYFSKCFAEEFGDVPSKYKSKLQSES